MVGVVVESQKTLVRKKVTHTHTPSSSSVGETQGSAEPTCPTDGGIGSLSEAMKG